MEPETNSPACPGGEAGPERSSLGSYRLKACTTSFTSMVPITIFSLCTVSWAAPAGRASRVSRTRLPLVSVFPANLAREEGKGLLCEEGAQLCRQDPPASTSSCLTGSRTCTHPLPHKGLDPGWQWPSLSAL